MVVCTANNCSNSSRIKNMRFFKFPNEEIRRNVWLKNSGLEKEPGPFAKLCEVHFDQNQFEENSQDGLRNLKSNAIPTLFFEVGVKEKHDTTLSSTVSSAPEIESNSTDTTESESEDDVESILPSERLNQEKDDSTPGLRTETEIETSVESISPATKQKTCEKNNKEEKEDSKENKVENDLLLPSIKKTFAKIENIRDIIKKYVPNDSAYPNLFDWKHLNPDAVHSMVTGEDRKRKYDEIPSISRILTTLPPPEKKICKKLSGSTDADEKISDISKKPKLPELPSNDTNNSTSEPGTEIETETLVESDLLTKQGTVLDEDQCKEKNNEKTKETERIEDCNLLVPSIPSAKIDESGNIEKKYLQFVSATSYKAYSKKSLAELEEKSMLLHRNEMLQKEIKDLKVKHAEEIKKLENMHRLKIIKLNYRLRRKFKDEVKKRLGEIIGTYKQQSSENELLRKELKELENHEEEMRKENEAMLGEIDEFMKSNKVMRQVVAELEKHNHELSSKLMEVGKSLKDSLVLNSEYKIHLKAYLPEEQIERIGKT